MRRNSVWIIGGILVIAGSAGIMRCPSQLGQKFHEAFLAAGVLSLSVDWWLKRKLQEDAAKDIFHHLLGITLPEKLRAKMQKLLKKMPYIEKTC